MPQQPSQQDPDGDAAQDAQQGQPPAAAGPQQGNGPDAKPNAPPQLQAAYNQFVNDCYRILFNPQAFSATMKLIASNQDPVKGLASAAVMIVLQAQEADQKKGQPAPSPVVILGGAAEMMINIALACATAHIHIFTPQENGRAVGLAIGMYQQQAAKLGLINPQQAQQQVQANQHIVFTPVLSALAFAKQLAAAHKANQPAKGGPPGNRPPPAAGPQQPPAPPQAGGGLMNQQGGQ